MSTSSPSIDQIISQASLMNSFAAPFDLNTLFEDFDDANNTNNNNTTLASKPLSTDQLMHTFLSHPSPSPATAAPTPTMDFSPMIHTPCLDAFNTPATAFMTDSPMMTTPYMDPLMSLHSSSSGSILSTPLIDASSTPFMGAPACDQFFTPHLNATTMDDSALLAAAAIKQDDDSLFPPLTNHDDNHTVQPMTTTRTTMDDDMDVLFDDLFGAPAPSAADNTNVFPSNHSLKRSAPSDFTSPPPTKHTAMTTPSPSSSSTSSEFVCTICQRSFSRRYNLGTHIKTHNKDRIKPFQCSLCPKSFDRKHDCERHLSTVHRGERLFTCHPCGVSFSRRDALHRHQLQKH